MKPTSFLLLQLAIGALLILGPPPAAAQPACDIPLIIQQGSVPPNVLFILDNSGSMNAAVWHNDYDQSIAYSGRFTSTKTYYVGSTGMYEPRDFSYYWEQTPSAPLIRSDMGNSGRYLGNYLNWVFYHATDEQRATLPQVTRMQVARQATNQVMRAATGLRYGLMVFNYSSGGLLLAPLGTDPATLESIVNNTEADSWTPTGETLYSALKYFRDSGNAVEYRCQQNFIVLVSDGLPTKDRDVPSWIGDQDGDGNEPGTCASIGAPYSESNDCRDYMDDVAYYMAHNDLRDDYEGDQFVYTYSIGFGLDAPILRDTAINGKGLYRVAWDLESLVQSLGTVIGDIVNRISSGAAVAVVSTEQSGENMLYRGKFMPGLWQGFLEAHRLPYDPNNSPTWEAGEILKSRSPGNRTIFTSIGENTIEFNVGNAGELMIPMGLADVGYAERVIDFVRGQQIDGFRERHGAKLGDLVYSTPVVVAKPSYFYLDPGYQQFLINYQDRMPTVYVGANDGMLHAFNAETGHEIWAYIPEAVLGKLEDLTKTDYCHTTYVDLSPKAYDIQINGSWRTILVGGLRTGGDAYFAIDVTNPNAPEFLWETSVPQIYSSFTEAKFVNSRYGPLLWTGSGPDPMGEASFAALYIHTGQLLGWGFYGNNGATNMSTVPTPIDIDYDGQHDFVYQADLNGNLWRWDLRDSQVAGIYGTMIYMGDDPIQGAPAVTTDVEGNVRVYFGTGQYVDASDINTTDQRGFYCVVDRVDENILMTRFDLVNQTSTINELDPGQGWYFNLTNGFGERVVESAAIVDGVVYFTSFAPNTIACSAGGESWLYAVDYRNGSSAQEDGELGSSTNARSQELGEGVASRPIINLADGSLVVQTSDARLNVSNLRTTPRRIQVHSWREMYPDAETASTATQILNGTGTAGGSN